MFTNYLHSFFIKRRVSREENLTSLWIEHVRTQQTIKQRIFQYFQCLLR